MSERWFVTRSLLRWLRSRPRSSLTPSPNGIPRASNKNQALPKSLRLRPRTTSERSGKVITTVSRTPPNPVRRLMSLRGRQRTRRYNNNAGALTIFWKSGGPTFRKIAAEKGARSARKPRSLCAFHAYARWLACGPLRSARYALLRFRAVTCRRMSAPARCGQSGQLLKAWLHLRR